MNVRQLEAFRAVMLVGSVTGAGDLLRLTQPTVSKLVAQLEHQTGLRLFERVRGRLVPRPEAVSLFQQVDKVFAAMEEVGRNARQLARGRTGHLRVVSIPALGLGLLPRAIGTFLAARPDVTVELNVRASTYVAEWIAGRQADLGFATATAVASGALAEPLRSLEGVCILPAGHPLADHETVGPLDLAGERFISLGRETAFRHLVDGVFEDAGIARRIVIETGYSATACALVAAGAGVAIVDPLSALDGWHAGGVILRPFRPATTFAVNVLVPAQASRSVLAQEFLDTTAALIDEAQAALRDATAQDRAMPKRPQDQAG